MSKTSLDLYQEAAAAALGAMDLTSNLAIQSVAHSMFNAGKNDEADWDYWSDRFYRLRELYIQLSGTPPASVVNARIAEVAALAKSPNPADQEIAGADTSTIVGAIREAEAEVETKTQDSESIPKSE